MSIVAKRRQLLLGAGDHVTTHHSHKIRYGHWHEIVGCIKARGELFPEM